MVDFRELGIKKFVEGSGLGDEDFEIIGKIYNLSSDPLVSKIEEDDCNHLSMSSSYRIYLRKTIKRDEVFSFLGDHKLKVDGLIKCFGIPYFIIQTPNREHSLYFFNEENKKIDYSIFDDDGTSGEDCPF